MGIEEQEFVSLSQPWPEVREWGWGGPWPEERNICHSAVSFLKAS